MLSFNCKTGCHLYPLNLSLNRNMSDYIESLPEKNYKFHFDNFKFEYSIHDSAINYLFNKNPIDLTVTNGIYIWHFKDRNEALFRLSEDQMLFLCGICFNLKLKPELYALSEILSTVRQITPEYIESYVREDQFKMTIRDIKF